MKISSFLDHFKLFLSNDYRVSIDKSGSLAFTQNTLINRFSSWVNNKSYTNQKQESALAIFFMKGVLQKNYQNEASKIDQFINFKNATVNIKDINQLLQLDLKSTFNFSGLKELKDYKITIEKNGGYKLNNLDYNEFVFCKKNNIPKEFIENAHSIHKKIYEYLDEKEIEFCKKNNIPKEFIENAHSIHKKVYECVDEKKIEDYGELEEIGKGAFNTAFKTKDNSKVIKTFNDILAEQPKNITERFNCILASDLDKILGFDCIPKSQVIHREGRYHSITDFVNGEPLVNFINKHPLADNKIEIKPEELNDIKFAYNKLQFEVFLFALMDCNVKNYSLVTNPDGHIGIKNFDNDLTFSETIVKSTSNKKGDQTAFKYNNDFCANRNSANEYAKGNDIVLENLTANFEPLPKVVYKDVYDKFSQSYTKIYKNFGVEYKPGSYDKQCKHIDSLSIEPKIKALLKRLSCIEEHLNKLKNEGMVIEKPDSKITELQNEALNDKKSSLYAAEFLTAKEHIEDKSKTEK